MEVTLLCVGDVVGAPGRLALREALTVLVPQHKVDCVIVNAENVAGGSGLTSALYQKLIHYGVQLITLGDHIYRRRDVIPILERETNLVRPANFPSSAPGKEFALYTTAGGQRVAVLSVLGRMFMKPVMNCPFAAADRVLSSIPKDVRIIVVDVHAEATSEKVALGWYLDGRVSVVFGTHTHIPTADERVLPKGTAYITDLGMTGPYDSVLGRDRQRVIRTMTTGVPDTLDVATDDVRLCGALVAVEASSGRAIRIERVQYRVTSTG